VYSKYLLLEKVLTFAVLEIFLKKHFSLDPLNEEIKLVFTNSSQHILCIFCAKVGRGCHPHFEDIQIDLRQLQELPALVFLPTV